MTTTHVEYDAGPNLPHLGPEARLVFPEIRRMRRRDATSEPTFRRCPGSHLPEEGLGGSDWAVTYRGDLIGFVYSTWDRRGVHFRTRDIDGYTIAEDETRTTPRAFETRADATNHLLDIAGIDMPEPMNYDLVKGPRGGGEDRLDRRY